jgi:hypothetical protein
LHGEYSIVHKEAIFDLKINIKFNTTFQVTITNALWFFEPTPIKYGVVLACSSSGVNVNSSLGAAEEELQPPLQLPPHPAAAVENDGMMKAASLIHYVGPKLFFLQAGSMR